MKVIKYLGFNRAFADFKGLCGANPKYLTTAEQGGISFEISPFRNTHYPINHQCLNF
jgi:hypothetical protein